MAKYQKPQLSDQEVALIKAMIDTKNYKRQEILSYFSRPDRHVNLARISEIGNGSKRASVKPASRAKLAAFLKSFETTETTGDPLAPVVTAGLLKLGSKNPMRLAIGEDERVEFKASFNWSGRAKYAKTIAGFANHNGGYIVFGIEDGGRVRGLTGKAFADRDPSEITRYLASVFQPEIIWKRAVTKLGSKSVGLMWIAPCERKPVICSKPHDVLKEGDIYYRYVGETRTIGYAELRTILDQRDRQTEQSLANTVSKIAEIGSGKTGLLDTTTGQVSGNGGSFLIEDDLLQKVRFINKGTFSEVDGEPTLRVIGDVTPIKGVSKEVVKGEKSVLTTFDVLADFINQRKVDDPKGYLRQIVFGQTYLIPIFYYVSLAELSITDAVKLLKDQKTSYEATRLKTIKRLKKRKGCFVSPGPTAQQYREKLLAKKQINFKSAPNRNHAVRAIRTLRPEDIDKKHCLNVLKAALAEYDRAQAADFLTEIRYAATHVDAAVFSGSLLD